MAQLFDCGNPASTKCTGMPTVSAAEATVLASGSCQSEGLFYWSFSVAWAVPALTGHPTWGSSLFLLASGT